MAKPTSNGTPEHHPVADLFPMLPDEELRDLARDIADRGLLQPIVLDKEGRILDGRNRYAACEMVNVEPTFTTYEGNDPDGYALAVNIARRHLNKGQIAMVAARTMRLTGAAYGDKSKNAKKLGISPERIRQADVVLDYAHDLADAVVVGTEPLDHAYEEARTRKQAAESRDVQMVRLREQAPDLADLVTDERMTLAEGIAALNERERQRAQEIQVATNNLKQAVILIDPGVVPPTGFAEEWLATLDVKQLDRGAVERVVDMLRELLKVWRNTQ